MRSSSLIFLISTIMKVLAVIVLLWGVASAEVISWDNHHFVMVRREVLNWWKSNGTPAKMECSAKDNQDAIQKYTRALQGKNCVTKMVSLHNLMLAASNTPFVGINETLMALRALAAEVVYISATKQLSVYDFRNPLTGSHLYQVCQGTNCDSRKEITDGTDYGTYLLESCLPLPTFINKRYGKNAPTVFSTNCKNDFFQSIGQLGGILKPGFLFHTSLSPQTYHPSKPRKFRVILRSYSKK